MKNSIKYVAILTVCMGLSQVQRAVKFSSLTVENNTGIPLFVQIYFLYTNIVTQEQERVFPCEHEVLLDEKGTRWTCKNIQKFSAADIAEKLKLTGEALKKANNTVGPYLDIRALDRSDIRVQPIIQKRILRIGTYVIKKESESLIQVKEQPVKEISLVAELQQD